MEVFNFMPYTYYTRMTVRAGEWLLRSHPLPPLTRSPSPWQAGGGKNVTLTINCGASRHHNPLNP